MVILLLHTDGNQRWIPSLGYTTDQGLISRNQTKIKTLYVVPCLDNINIIAISHNLYSYWLSLTSPRARAEAIDLPPILCTSPCLHNTDLAFVVSAAGAIEQAGLYMYNCDVFFDSS